MGLALVPFTLSLSCQLAVNIDGLTDQKCEANQKACNGRCVSRTNPMTGCALGTCAPCVLPHAIATCGPTLDCAVGGCVGDYDHCIGTEVGCETDLAHDPVNCGTCGHICPKPANGKPGCSAKLCAVGGCDRPWEDCNHAFDDGCETNLDGDDQNCGACAHPCPVDRHCQAGTCAN